MTTTLVLPTDNAVIDYSIISQIIAAINAQQQQIDAFTKSTATVDPVTNTTVVQKVVGDVITPDSTGKLFNIDYPIKGLTKIQSIVGIPYTGGSTTCNAWIFSLRPGTHIQFKTNIVAKSLYYIAIGT
jgi:hypothetical protein